MLVQVAFSVVRYNSATGEKQGVCTSWLEGLCRPFVQGEGDGPAKVHIPVFLRRGGAFGLPASLSAPLLMIGPGTGVAPFRGFLQHRLARPAHSCQFASFLLPSPSLCPCALPPPNENQPNFTLAFLNFSHGFLDFNGANDRRDRARVRDQRW